LSPQKPLRRWLAWTIGGVWVATALAVLIATRIHPSTTANVSLSLREISFRTNASRILGPSDEEQLLISGVGSLQIQLNTPQTIQTGGPPVEATSLQIDGEPSASCTLYQVHSSGFDLTGPAIITLGVPSIAATRSFNLKVHGPFRGNLTSRSGEHDLKPGLECTRVHVNGGPPGNMTVSFSPQGGDSIFFATSDAQLTFDLTPQSEIGDTQIPILKEIRFSHIDAHTSEEKTVLLKPPAGYKNEVSFEKLNKSVTINDADLLVVVPKKNDFYLRQFTVKDGVQVSLHGIVRDVRTGAGVTDLATLMPSSFDHLDNVKRIYGVVPALVAFILGILEKMGGLPER
jgi:hypothetical protein